MAVNSNCSQYFKEIPALGIVLEQMIRREFEQELMTSRMRVVYVLWLGMAATAVIIGIVVWVMAEEWVGREPLLPDDRFIPVFHALAFCAALASFVIRRILLAPSHLAKDSESLKVSLEQSGLSKATNELEIRAEISFLRFQSGSLATWAMCDAICILGFILSYSTGDPNHAYQLCIATVLLILLLHKPATGNLTEALSLLKRQGVGILD